MKKLFSLLLALSMVLSCTIFAETGTGERDAFDASLIFGKDASGNMTVTVQDSSILASQKPTLTIPCSHANAYVTFNGQSVTSSLENGVITFVVAAGGTYTIIEGVDPNQSKPDPEPEPEPDPAPSTKPSTSDKDSSDKSGYTEIIVGDETASGSQVEISAKVEIESGSAQVTIDSEKLEESLTQQATQTPDSGTAAPSETPVTVTIDLSKAEEAVTTVTVDSTSVAAIADAAVDSDNAVSGLTVKVDAGEVTLDAGVLEQVAAVQESLVVEVNTPEPETLTKAQQKIVKDMPVVEINVTVGDTRLTDLGDGRINVTVPYTPKNEHKVDDLVVWRVLDDGKIVPIQCVYENGKVRFVLDHLSYYVVVSFPFTDFTANDWYYQDVAYVWSAGLMNGTGTNTFSPGSTTSRGMLVTILWRLEGEPSASACSFADVKSGSYYEQAIAWAAENSIVTGYSASSFRPDSSITREQFATILYRYAKDYKGYDMSVGEDTNILSYTDAFNISEYAIPAMQWACGAGLINGSNGALMPGGHAVRAQAAAILHRFNNQIK